MALRLILGNSGSENPISYISILLRNHSRIADGYLVIVPEQFTMQTQKDLVTMHQTKGSEYRCVELCVWHTGSFEEVGL